MTYSPPDRHHLPTLIIISGLMLTLYYLSALFLRPLHPIALTLLGIHLGLHVWCVGVSVKTFFGSHTLERGGILLIGLFSATVCCLIVLGLLPATASDALIQHLAVPKWWARADALIEIPWHEWSYYPMLLNLPFILFLKLNLEWLASLYHGSYLILAIGVLTLQARTQFAARFASFYPGLLLLLFPITLKLASSPLVDLGLSLFALLAIYFMTKLSEERFDAAFAGIAIGLALSTKYSGLLAAPLLIAAGIVGQIALGRTFLRVSRNVVLTTTFALLIYSPWALHNYLLTGNPIFPLYKSTFATAQTKATPGVNAPGPLMHRVEIYGESLTDILLLPFRVLVTGRDNVPSAFDGRLSFLTLFIPAALGFIASGAVRAHLLFSASFLPLALLYSIARVRYLAPIFPSLALLSSLGISFVASRASFLRRLPLILLIIHGGLGLFYLRDLMAKRHAFGYLTGAVTREVYLSRALEEYVMIAEMNRILEPTSKVYLLQVPNHYYYYDIPVYSAGHFSASQLVNWLHEGVTAKTLRDKFKALGVTHVFIHVARTKELLSALDPIEIAPWNEFTMKELNFVRIAGPYSLWKIEPPVVQ